MRRGIISFETFKFHFRTLFTISQFFLQFQKFICNLHLTDTPELTFKAVDDPEWDGDEYGPRVPGTAIPEGFRQAVLKGVMEAFQESGQHKGVQFELLHATHHPVDASERMFRHSAWIALAGWLEQQSAETCEKPAPNPNQQE